MLEQYVKIRILFQSIYQMLEQYVKIRILFQSIYQMLEQYVKICILFQSIYEAEFLKPIIVTVRFVSSCL